jgi:hypothetical protein
MILSDYKTVIFKNINVGENFRYNGLLYTKTLDLFLVNKPYNAINVNNNVLYYFDPEYECLVEERYSTSRDKIKIGSIYSWRLEHFVKVSDIISYSLTDHRRYEHIHTDVRVYACNSSIIRSEACKIGNVTYTVDGDFLVETGTNIKYHKNVFPFHLAEIVEC